MKWKAKTTRADFEANATRRKQVFAWFPTYVNGFIYWLRFYEVLEYNKVEIINVIINGDKVAFKKSDWVEISRR